jgi:hypothetical protein
MISKIYQLVSNHVSIAALRTRFIFPVVNTFHKIGEMRFTCDGGVVSKKLVF